MDAGIKQEGAALKPDTPAAEAPPTGEIAHDLTLVDIEVGPALRSWKDFAFRAGNRSGAEAARLLYDAYYAADAEYSPNSEISLEELAGMLASRQGELWYAGNGLCHLPNEGTLHVTSDIEGKYRKFAGLVREIDFVSRVQGGEPVYLALLGDYVDFGSRQVDLVEFLQDLKRDPLIGPHLVLLLGTHEWDLNQGKQLQNSGFMHMVLDHPQYQTPAADDRFVQWAVQLFNQRFHPDESGRRIVARNLTNPEPELAAHMARLALWGCDMDFFRRGPHCAFADNGLFLAHGGPAVHGFFNPAVGPEEHTRAEYLLQLASATHELVNDLVWSVYHPEQRGLGRNPRAAADVESPFGAQFGPDMLSGFLQKVGCSLFVRGHQGNAPEGIQETRLGAWEHGQIRTITMQTSRDYLTFDLSRPA
jgi:hypothetical protein